METMIVEEGGQETEALYERALLHIRESYRSVFSAQNDTRPARLVITLTRQGKIACAAGIRCYDEGFFSQQYLDEPVSDLMSRKSGLMVAPEGVLEVGALACASPFAVYPMLHAVFDWGRARGIGWGLFTATEEVRRLIRRAKIAPVMLAKAEASRVSSPEQWGAYYDHDPWVCAFRDPAQAPEMPVFQGESA